MAIKTCVMVHMHVCMEAGNQVYVLNSGLKLLSPWYTAIWLHEPLPAVR